MGAGRALLLTIALAGCAEPVDPCLGRPDGVFFEDVDRDGHGDASRRVITCLEARPEGWVELGDDCDPLRPSVLPGGLELCDGLDNDCDGATDEGLGFRDFFRDADGDGVGTVEHPTRACDAPPGTSLVPGDCDDGDPAVLPGALEVCNGTDDDCDGLIDDEDPDVDPAGQGTWHPDLDADGYGSATLSVQACEQPFGTRADASDCDDASPFISPLASEICDGLDNDCDGRIDDSDPSLSTSGQGLWFADVDQDGFGDANEPLITCTTPWYHVQDGSDCDDGDARIGSPTTTGWLVDGDGDGVGAGGVFFGCAGPSPSHVVLGPEGLDCDDTDPGVSPRAVEVCNDRDDDCDGLLDDADPSRVADLLWFPDLDADGFGGPPEAVCVPSGPFAAVGGDCDDLASAVFPGAIEVCNGGVDDDCNGLADDLDPFTDTSTGLTTWRDQDGDGFGAPGTGRMDCALAPGRAGNASDCSDTNSTLGPPIAWWADQDGDGFGAGPLSPFGCAPPDEGFVMPSVGEDCDDVRPDVRPGAPEVCDDGRDQDCDGVDPRCPRPTCADWLADGLSDGDGVYTIAPEGVPVEVFCDMTTAGGGWTLVSSTLDPVDDQATGWSPQLTTLSPDGPMDGLWAGLRDVLPPSTDLRFACKLDLAAPEMSVDLVFFDTHWYLELTSGTDAQVCFNETDGAGADSPPRRRNLLTGATRAAGNPWSAGYLEGEDLCDSPDDFTVDFDDRGMDGNQFDGTDWGEDDDLVKCGVTNQGAAWFIFVR